jgi:signal transduction histidine kinase
MKIKRFTINNEISKTAKISLLLSGLILLTYFVVQSFVIFGVIKPSINLSYFGYVSMILFTPLFMHVVQQFLNRKDMVEKELVKKNTYLEHSAKILRHDMHSGINVYIPRGLSSLERRLTPEQIKSLKIEAPLKMIREGLKHTQKVYKGVYEFTNLVKQGTVLERTNCKIGEILDSYLTSTSYRSQIKLSKNLPTMMVNESLFCTAVDNLIRNGLKYNDSSSKVIKIYKQGPYICIEDNGRGLTNKEYIELSKAYVRKKGQVEQGSGLGLNICNSILEEHHFTVEAERLYNGKTEFLKELNHMESKVNLNTEMNVFNKQSLLKKAKENNYLGKLIVRRDKHVTKKAYILYEDGTEKKVRGTKIKINVHKHKSRGSKKR